MPAIQIKNVPVKIYKRIKNVSKMNHRSVSGEILYILETNLFKEERTKIQLFDRIENEKEKIERKFGQGPLSAAEIRRDRGR